MKILGGWRRWNISSTIQECSAKQTLVVSVLFNISILKPTDFRNKNFSSRKDRTPSHIKYSHSNLLLCLPDKSYVAKTMLL